LVSIYFSGMRDAHGCEYCGDVFLEHFVQGIGVFANQHAEVVIVDDLELVGE